MIGIYYETEFDVVTLDKNGYVSYECKYTNSKIDNRIIVEEEKQMKNLSINFYKLGFIAKNGFSVDVDEKNIIALVLLIFISFSYTYKFQDKNVISL